MKKRVFCLLILFAILLGGVTLAAGSAEEEKEEEIVYYLIRYNERSEAVQRIQEQLSALGYFRDSEAAYELGFFDEATLNAIRLFCKEHNIKFDEDGVSPEGITPELQKLLLESSPAPRATYTPEPTLAPTPVASATPFPSYKLGDSSIEINNVQKALSDKGYFEGIEDAYVAGVFDEVTEQAVSRFCQIIGAKYVPETGLNEALYVRIIATDAPVFSKPSPTPFSIIFYGTVSDEVRTAQQRLNELDYFRDFGEPEWGTYEEITQQAVRKFCEVNDLEVHPNGIDPFIWEKLWSENTLPNPVLFQDIVRGDQNEQVEEIQDRLFALGYYKNLKRTGVCDDDMMAAAALFAQANQIVFDSETITVAIYNAIFNENALSYSEEVVKIDFFQKVSNFLTGNVAFLGMQMPGFVVILLVAIVLAALIFLLIRAFSPDKEKKTGNAAQNNQNENNWNAAGNSSQPGRRIELEIRYQGTVQSVTINVDHVLRIGRQEHTLPLNERDSDISRRHCEIYFHGDTLFLRDHSTNGTSVDGRPYRNCECVIHPGNKISIGNHEIIVRRIL